MDIRQIKLEKQLNINKNSKKDNTNINTSINSKESTNVAISKYLNGVREYVDKIIDPVNEMSEQKKQEYKNKILRMLEQGKKLSNEQMQYIKKYMPEMYPQVMKIQMQRQALEESLKHCKSKEQANDIYTNAMLRVNKDEPMAKALIAAYNDVMKVFRKSDFYKSLPATEEDAKQSQKNNQFYKDPFAKESDNGEYSQVEISYFPDLQCEASTVSFNG